MRSLIILVWLSLLPCTVWAHPLIEQARRQYDSADFLGALESLDAASNTQELRRDDLVELLVLRVLISFASGDNVRLDEALRDLAALSPEHTFPVEAPPALVARFDAVSVESSSLEVLTEESGAEVVIEASLLGGLSSMVQQVVVHGRIEEEPWRRGADGLRVAGQVGDRVEWYVEVLGPGGAVIFHRGSAAEPEELLLQQGTDRDRERRLRPWAWGLIGAAIAVVATTVIVAAVVSTREPDNTDTTVWGPVIHDF